ncbi:hypothetical protein EKQ61_01505 [Staphylococcus gallinarum]|nr:hypothetical protein EKQ61_01505 [Staphylococcus gallinarum]
MFVNRKYYRSIRTRLCSNQRNCREHWRQTMRILKTLTIIFLYELSKYITEQVIIRLQASDVCDYPKDYEVSK